MIEDYWFYRQFCSAVGHSIILFLQEPMLDKSQITCNCFGPSLPLQQKFFLTRKRQPQESESLQSSRRVIKSSEIKQQGEAKSQKKSLKKRASSFVHSENHNVGSNEPNRQQGERASFMEEAVSNRNNSWSKAAQTPSYATHNQFFLKLPQNTTTIRQPIFLNSHKQFPQTKHYSTTPANHEPFLYHPVQPDRNHAQSKPQIPQFNKQSSQRQQYQFQQLKQYATHKVSKQDQKPSVSAHQITFREPFSHSAVYLSQKSIRKQTPDNWFSIEDPVLVEDFQKLFKNKDENKGTHIIPNQIRVIKPRQAQKSKRFQHQQLMGRFAQSEDQDCAESMQSEVIGKGFDRTYQDLLDQPILASQTKASRSTNTKFSNLKGSKCQNAEFEGMRFGNIAHFTSFDRL